MVELGLDTFGDVTKGGWSAQSNGPGLAGRGGRGGAGRSSRCRFHRPGRASPPVRRSEPRAVCPGVQRGLPDVRAQQVKDGLQQPLHQHVRRDDLGLRRAGNGEGPVLFVALMASSLLKDRNATGTGPRRVRLAPCAPSGGCADPPLWNEISGGGQVGAASSAVICAVVIVRQYPANAPSAVRWRVSVWVAQASDTQIG